MNTALGQDPVKDQDLSPRFMHPGIVIVIPALSVFELLAAVAGDVPIVLACLLH